MSMCIMPLLIKTLMTKQNYLLLLSEASKIYCKSYLRKHYLFDGKYFTLDTCDMDSYDIYSEAKLIAKYAERTDDCVGLIHAGCGSYLYYDLYFQDRNPRTLKKNLNPDTYSVSSAKDDYLQRRQEFLSGFPTTDIYRITDAEIEALLKVDIQYKGYTCIGIEQDELIAIFEQNGHLDPRIYTDMGCVSIQMQDKAIDPIAVLSDFFQCAKVNIFCRDGDQTFPNTFMILLQDESK